MPISTDTLARKPRVSRDQQDHGQHEGGDGQVVERAVVGVVEHRDRPGQLHGRRTGGGHGRQDWHSNRSGCRSRCSGGLHAIHHLHQLGHIDALRQVGRPARPADAHAYQADADHRDDGAGDHRRDEAQHAADQRRNQHRDDAGADDRAEYCAGAVHAGHRVGHRDHRTDRGERPAHHHRQLDAEEAAEAERLDQRDRAAAEQVGRDQLHDLVR